MKNQRALIALTIVNLALLLFVLVQQVSPAFADSLPVTPELKI
jgi:hypothetical protein